MPDLFFADLVRERSTGTGTAAFPLEGAMPGHRAFADAVPPGERFHYAIAGISDESEWEVGEGELDGTGALARTPISSSVGGGTVDFSAGVKAVSLTVGASWFAGQEAGGSVEIGPVDLADVTGLQAALDGKQIAGEYAAEAHEHDGVYAPVTHVHDGVYAAFGHSHDGEYAPVDHDHAATYSPLGHDHEGVYAPADHSHPEYEGGGGGGLAPDASGNYGMGTATPRSRLDIRGALSGGFGGDELNTGTAIDWDGADQRRAGFGRYVLRASALNGPAEAGTSFLHALNLEYGAAKDGTGHWTQIAVPYAHFESGFWFRGRFIGQPPSVWREFLVENHSAAFAPASDDAKSLGSATRRFSTVYLGSSPIVGSDAAIKTGIEPVPDAALDAWGDVGWSQYRMVAAVAEKGGAARLHTGLVAQHVRNAFAARGLDACAYGLLCFDAWQPGEEPEIGTDGEPTGATVPAGEAGSLWQIRYDEAQAMEAAWQRREIARLSARIAALSEAA